ncbi:MAG TPA: flippase activity-associated protein Agl23 [Verrucomicrobiae bacterium]|nr:flippase activity-associated protein Agl23 [Verrucomicrobiae bacterium]
MFVALALLALAVRLPRLAERPMHTDESINAYITGELLAGEAFHYDPKDRHGPVLFAVAEPLVKLLGARKYTDLTETELRLTPVIIGSAMVLLVGAGVEMFGFIPCLVAALLFAFAPLPVYYSRYFIHETLFVAATLGLILTGWRAWQKNSAWSAALAGLCAGLLLACKETAVIHLFALGLAMICAWLLPPREKFPSLKIIGVAIIVCLFMSVMLFTWFGQNWAVFADLRKAVPNFTARAGGEGHAKPFSYYFHLLDPTMVLMIVAVGGGYAAICEAVSRTRKPYLPLAIYGLAVFLIYSAIPYKTPWLALNIWLPLAFVCGFGVEAFWDQMKNAGGRWFVGIAGAFLLSVLGAQTKLYAFDQPADEKNPYAYAHTVDDLLGLPPRIAELAKKENLAQPRIAVVAADAWPLPWYLRNFSQVGYWQPGQDPGPQDFYITTTDVPASLDERLKNFNSEYFGVRPNVLLVLWVPAAKEARP